MGIIAFVAASEAHTTLPTIWQLGGKIVWQKESSERSYEESMSLFPLERERDTREKSTVRHDIVLAKK